MDLPMIHDLDTTNKRAVADYATGSFQQQVIASCPDSWDELRQQSVIACIKYVVLGTDHSFIIRVDPTMHVAWLTQDEVELIAQHIARAIDMVLWDIQFN